jgi:hypothetical protein
MLGNYIKGVMPGGLNRFTEFAVSSLPDDASAAGIRPGAINTLCTNVPVQLCASNTGHDFRGFSSFFEYVGALIPQLMTGAVLLAGYPPLTWGVTGKGPVPASFAALVAPGVDEEKLELMLIALFQVSCAVSAASTDHHPLLAQTERYTAIAHCCTLIVNCGTPLPPPPLLLFRWIALLHLCCVLVAP